MEGESVEWDARRSRRKSNQENIEKYNNLNDYLSDIHWISHNIRLSIPSQYGRTQAIMQRNKLSSPKAA